LNQFRGDPARYLDCITARPRDNRVAGQVDAREDLALLPEGRVPVGAEERGHFESLRAKLRRPRRADQARKNKAGNEPENRKCDEQLIESEAIRTSSAIIG
jgi:hypothetical protein